MPKLVSQVDLLNINKYANPINRAFSKPAVLLLSSQASAFLLLLLNTPFHNIFKPSDDTTNKELFHILQTSHYHLYTPGLSPPNNFLLHKVITEAPNLGVHPEFAAIVTTFTQLLLVELFRRASFFSRFIRKSQDGAIDVQDLSAARSTNPSLFDPLFTSPMTTGIQKRTSKPTKLPFTEGNILDFVEIDSKNGTTTTVALSERAMGLLVTLRQV